MAKVLDKWVLSAKNEVETAKKKLALLNDALKECKSGAEKKIIYVEVNDFCMQSLPCSHILYVYFNDGSVDRKDYDSVTILELYRDYIVDEAMIKHLEYCE